MSEPQFGPPLKPVVARPARSRGALIVAALLAATTLGYGAILATKWEPATVERDELPASVRNSPGGYRSYFFWHSGYHGGK